jgi:hypothetical protein
MSLTHNRKENVIRFIIASIQLLPMPVAARSKGWVCGPPLLGLRVRIPPGAWMYVVSDVLPVRGLCVQRSPTDCGVSGCDRAASILRRLWSIGGCNDVQEIMIRFIKRSVKRRGNCWPTN